MNGSIFVDTNVLVYAYDRSEPVKQARAAEVLGRLAGQGAASSVRKCSASSSSS